MISLNRILLVDDSARDTELALDALDAYHLTNEVVALRDGAEALDYLYRRGSFADRPEGQPAVVLLDLKMPKVDGTEVLRQMKSDPKLKLIPVVVMTSSREEQDLLESYQLGASMSCIRVRWTRGLALGSTGIAQDRLSAKDTLPAGAERAAGLRATRCCG